MFRLVRLLTLMLSIVLRLVLILVLVPVLLFSPMLEFVLGFVLKLVLMLLFGLMLVLVFRRAELQPRLRSPRGVAGARVTAFGAEPDWTARVLPEQLPPGETPMKRSLWHSSFELHLGFDSP